MKCPLTIALLVLVGVSVIWIATSRRDNPQTGQPATEQPADDECPSDTLSASPATVAPVPEFKTCVMDGYMFGIAFKNIKLCARYHCQGDEDDHTMLIRYVDDIRADSAVVIGECDNIRGNGRFCELMWGVDSRTIDITQKLNKSIDMRFCGVVPGCEFHSYRFAQRFNVHIALPVPTPDWVLNNISWDVQSVVNSYDEDAELDSVVLEYDGKHDFLDRMLRYYYGRFCQRRLRQAAKEGDWFSASYSYQYYAYPVWVDEEHSRITYRTYDFRNMGGAHGGYSDYYSTYDIATGQLLGIEDLLSEQEMDKAVEQLEHYWYCYRKSGGDWNYFQASNYPDFDPNGRERADFGDDCDDEETFDSQTYKGRDYPRPAFTRHGVVFSYQMYDKGGCTAEGVRHFVVPYHKLK